MVGDSVRFSLNRVKDERIGKISIAMDTRDRYISERTVARFAKKLETTAAGVLKVDGVASTPDSANHANSVRVYGVPSSFWKLGLNVHTDPGLSLEPGTAAINHKLAQKLNVLVDDTIIARIGKPSLLPRDVSLAPIDDSQIAIRLQVSHILDSVDFGNMNLSVDQIAPYNLFLSLNELQRVVDSHNKVNLLLLAANGEGSISTDQLNRALQSTWTIEDLGLEFVPVGGNTVEISTDRIFIDNPIVDAVRSLTVDPTLLLTYFVNEIRFGQTTTPYSMVTALSARNSQGSPLAKLIPNDLQNNEIVLNAWAADDLGAAVGDEVTLQYYVVDDRHQISTKESNFRIKSILSMTTNGLDHSLSPNLSGLTDSENCRDWNTGIAIDFKRIRGIDEDYWDQYKATPKAIIPLAAGKSLWHNRFGDVTAIRFSDNDATSDELSINLARAIDPASVGFQFAPVAQLAASSVEQSMDFGLLFACFSFFVIVSALILTALLFVFNIEQRSSEQGILASLGFTPARIRFLYIFESLIVSIPAAVVGAYAGGVYTMAVVYGLSTIWHDAVGQWPISLVATNSSRVLGVIASVIISIIVVALMVRRVSHRTIHRQLVNIGEGQGMKWYDSNRLSIAALVLVIASALFVIHLASQSKDHTIHFFAVGMLMLCSTIITCSIYLNFFSSRTSRNRRNLGNLGFLSLTKRKWRNIAAISIVAFGTFTLVALEAQRLGANVTFGNREDGTGGFALLADVTQPIYVDLNRERERERIGFELDSMDEVGFVPFRVLPGDDASCLNLNRAQNPVLLGVDPHHLIQRHAFSFVSEIHGDNFSTPWELLVHKNDSGRIPAVADFNTIVYGLGKKIGDTLTYVDEHGNQLEIQLVAALKNSVLQGSILVNEEVLKAHFPSVNGYKFFLIDSPFAKSTSVEAAMNQRFRDNGINIVRTEERLMEYNAVQNTYISIFQVLGGIGLLLGSVGLGVVVLRNISERRSELAIMQALGFTRHTLRRLLLKEHSFLVFAGIGSGVVPRSFRNLSKT